MTIQDFMLEMEKELNAHFRDCGMDYVYAESSDVVKVNDDRLYGINVRTDDHMGRCVYLNDLYDRYEEGEDSRVLVHEAIVRCELALAAEMPPVQCIHDFALESIRNRLTVRLLSVRNNMSYLADRPYIDVGCGLALVAVINSKESALSEWVITVSNGLMYSDIRCGREELLTAALENTVRVEPPVLLPMRECIDARLMEDEEPSNCLEEDVSLPFSPDRAFILSNTSMFMGSSALFYPGIMERVSEIVGDNYYVLPCSVHEVIIMPASAKPDEDLLIDMIRRANDTVVDRKDLLSYDLYYYDRQSHELRVVKAVRTDMAGSCGNLRRHAG